MHFVDSDFIYGSEKKRLYKPNCPSVGEKIIGN